jgi:hypothetical protein
MYLDRGDLSPRRPVAAPCDESLDRRGFAFEHRLDQTVAAVADPAGHARGRRLPPAGLSEPHALDVSPDEHPTPDGHGYWFAVT